MSEQRSTYRFVGNRSTARSIALVQVQNREKRRGVCSETRCWWTRFVCVLEALDALLLGADALIHAAAVGVAVMATQDVALPPGERR